MTNNPNVPDLGQGVRNLDADKPHQVSRADLATMSAEAIVQAKAEGRLEDLLAGRNPE